LKVNLIVLTKKINFCQRCKWPRGKMLGGTSGLNYMLYVRGNKADFDHWAQLGNQGWSFEEV
jgi:choline dehydrogenase-like flavoprotein